MSLKRLYVYLVLLSLSISTVFAGVKSRQQVKQMTTQGHTPRLSYSAARHFMFTQIHLRQDPRGGYYIKDVYCQKVVYVNRNSIPANNVVNCEHTWPRSKFNSSQSFSVQEADLHHLYPSDSRANSMRGNHHFTDFRYDSPIPDCATSSFGHNDRGQSSFEPPDNHKGNVARALFYFSIRYDIAIPADEEAHLRRWNVLDPVDQMELRRNNLVQQAQGNRNPFIDNPSLADEIADF